MNSLIAFLTLHSFWTGIIAYWVFNAIVDAMPEPDEVSGKGYKFFYTLLHKLAGNLSVAFGDKIPGVQTKEIKRTISDKTETIVTPPDK